MALYLDASCIVPLFVSEPSSAPIAQLVEPRDDVLVSDYGVGETCAVISRKIRERLLTDAAAVKALDRLDRWMKGAVTVLECRPADMRRAQALVRRFELKLRFPDALQIAICEGHGAQLVTRDKLMGEAAGAIGLDVVTLA